MMTVLRERGLWVGPSRVQLFGLIKLAESDYRGVIVTIFPDEESGYLNTAQIVKDRETAPGWTSKAKTSPPKRFSGPAESHCSVKVHNY